MNERELTKDEVSDKEKYVKGMKKAKKDFKKRYGDDAESVMYATATKMAKEGLNETEENSVSDKKENVQAEERQENLNWLEDIKRLSGLDNTYENSADAMKEYKVDESEEKSEEVIAEGQSPAQKAAFQKMLDAKKGKKSDDDVEEQVEEASGVRADTKGKVDKSEKKHYHCKLTKDNKTKGVRMVADEGESEADVKARCKRENMGWELESMRKLDESLDENDDKKLPPEGSDAPYVDPEFAKHMADVEKKQEDVEMEGEDFDRSSVQPEEVMPFVKMTYKDIQDRIKRTRQEIELGHRDDIKMLEPFLRDLLDQKDVVASILNSKGRMDTESIIGNIMDSGLDTSVREELGERFKKQVAKNDPQLAKKLFKNPRMEGKKKDHDGDGDIDSNDYLAARDKAIKAAMAKKVDELVDLARLAGLEGKVELDELANEPGQGTEETSTYSVSDVVDQGNDLHAKSKQHADKAKLGDNPMATEEVDVLEGKLWKAYQTELEGVKK